MLDEYTYPAKRSEKPGGDFTVRHYILPIRIRGVCDWAWLDTGANVSIMPKEVATKVFGLRVRTDEDGFYTLAGLIDIPYISRRFTVNILQYLGGIPELNLSEYQSDSPVAVTLSSVEFQIPTLTWPEIAQRLESQTPVRVNSEEEMPWVILGLHGVLDQLNLSFVGENSVSISKKVQT